MSQHDISLEIQKFYSEIKFPGEYTIDDIFYHQSAINNPYLKIIDDHLDNKLTVLDAGCGSGYILNLFACKYDSRFTGIDFSDSIDYARSFSLSNNIKNVKYHKSDILDIDQSKKYDIVICQGVLHHIPDFNRVVKILQNITKKKLILGVYHPSGKILKKYLKLDYKNEILRMDQEDVPFELAFNKQKVISMFDEFTIIDNYPRNPFLEFLSNPFRYSRNGGLITYVLEKNVSKK
jgi:SAM-dependent methyltransferase